MTSSLIAVRLVSTGLFAGTFVLSVWVLKDAIGSDQVALTVKAMAADLRECRDNLVGAIKAFLAKLSRAGDR